MPTTQQLRTREATTPLKVVVSAVTWRRQRDLTQSLATGSDGMMHKKLPMQCLAHALAIPSRPNVETNNNEKNKEGKPWPSHSTYSSGDRQFYNLINVSHSMVDVKPPTE